MMTNDLKTFDEGLTLFFAFTVHGVTGRTAICDISWMVSCSLLTWIIVHNHRYQNDKLKKGCCRELRPEARRASTGTRGCCRFSRRQCAILPAPRGRGALVPQRAAGFSITQRRQKDLGSPHIGALINSALNPQSPLRWVQIDPSHLITHTALVHSSFYKVQ